MQTAFSTSTEQVFLWLLLQLVAILAASRLMGALARRLGHAPAVGEILAGILLGPTALGHVAPGLFSGGPEILPYLSHLGLVLALFLIGMEFDYREVPRHLGQVAGAAVGSLAVPLAVGWALAPLLLGAEAAPAGRLLVGMVLAITAIPILGRILIELGLTETRVGVLALTTGVVKDLGTWLLLLVVSGLARPPVSIARVAVAALVAAGLAALALGVIRPLLGRVQKVDGTTLAALLGFAFLMAATTSAVGLFGIFGAFLAGVAVSFNRPLARATSERLHDVTVYLLLPVFFTYTGLRVDLSSLSGADWAMTALFTVAGSLASGGVAALVARFNGFRWAPAGAYGVLVNTPGLMVLILLNIGDDLGVLPQRAFGVLLAAAMARNLLTSPIAARLTTVAPERVAHPTVA